MRRDDRSVFDQGVWGRSRWRAVRRQILFVALLYVFVDTQGLPEVRLRASDRGPTAAYLGLGGVRYPRPSSEGRRLAEPLVVLRPLERPLWTYGRSAINRVQLEGGR